MRSQTMSPMDGGPASETALERASNILLVAWGSAGNLGPILTGARQLRQQGHSCRVLADPAMQRDIQAAGFEFVRWRRAPTGAAADPSDLSSPADWFRTAVFEPAEAYARDTLDEIRRIPTDAVVCVDLVAGAIVGAERSGVPYAILSPHISLMPLPGIPAATSARPPGKTRAERAELEGEASAFVATFDRFLPLLNATRMTLGLEPLRAFFDLFGLADRVLLAINQAFDFQADAYPVNMRYIGPLLDVPEWTRGWVAPWDRRSTRPRVLITASTGQQGQTGLLQNMILAASSLDIEAVVTAGPHVPLADLPWSDNVHLLTGAPHDAVMKEVSLVVTQGGHGTVCRALLNDLPLLIVSNGRDQEANGARVETRGAGLRLDKKASTSEIAAAMRKLIEDKRFRNEARTLGAAMRIDVSEHRFASEIESIMRSRRENVQVLDDRLSA